MYVCFNSFFELSFIHFYDDFTPLFSAILFSPLHLFMSATYLVCPVLSFSLSLPPFLSPPSPLYLSLFYNDLLNVFLHVSFFSHFRSSVLIASSSLLPSVSASLSLLFSAFSFTSSHNHFHYHFLHTLSFIHALNSFFTAFPYPFLYLLCIYSSV